MKRIAKLAQKAQISLTHRYVPTEYSSWDETRRQLWDAIPFNANEYYLKYLPPMVSGRSEDWSEEEKKELLETVNVRMRIVCECRIILQMISGVCFHFIFLVVQVKKYG